MSNMRLSSIIGTLKRQLTFHYWAPVLVALALIESGMKYEDAVEFIRRWGMHWFFNSGKKVQCVYAPWLCVLPLIFDAYFWRHHNMGRLVRSKLWQCEQNSDLVNYFWQLICLLHKSLPFTKRRLWKLESRSKMWSFNVEYSIPINKVSNSVVTLPREIFLWNNLKSCVLLTCQLELRKLFVKVKIILITYFEYCYLFFQEKKRSN